MSGNGPHSAQRVWYQLANTDLIPFSRPSFVAVEQGMTAYEFLDQAKKRDAQKTAHFDPSDLVLYLVAGGFLAQVSESLQNDAIEISNQHIFTQDQSQVEEDSSSWTRIPDRNDKKIYYLVRVPSVTPTSALSQSSDPLPLLVETSTSKSTSPSQKATMSPTDLAKTDFNWKVEYGCPRTTGSLSLTLVSEVFAKFERDSDGELGPSRPFLQRYAEAAIKFADQLSQPVDELTLMNSFNETFNSLFATKLTHVLSPYKTDGHWECGRLLIVLEGKARVPAGDPLVQGVDYYRHFSLKCRRALESEPEEVHPAFLLTYQGPLINVYGLAIVDAGLVQCEHFATVNAGCHWTNDGEMIKFTRILYALDEAFKRLKPLPSLLPDHGPPSKRAKTGAKRHAWPYPRSFTDLASGEEVGFRYLARLGLDEPGKPGLNRYLFKVQTIEGNKPETFLVKFTRSYGRAVHEELARHNYAPSLRGLTAFGRDWNMAVMEYLDNQEWVDGTKASSDIVDRYLPTVEGKILPLLQQHRWVHGDMRLANLMFSTTGMDAEHGVRVIDFDFSGKENEVFYPWCLVTTIRPDGIKPFSPLKCEDDTLSVQLIRSHLRGSNGTGTSRGGKPRLAE